MDNFDDLLASVGIDGRQGRNPMPMASPIPRIIGEETHAAQAAEPAAGQASALSDSDLMDILNDNGFNDTQTPSPEVAGSPGNGAEPDGGGDVADDEGALDDDDFDEELEVDDEDVVLDSNGVVEDSQDSTGRAGNGEAGGSNALLPLNSPTLLVDDSTSRFSGTEWYTEIQRQRVILAGLGGIGSWLCLQLARMAPATLVLYDPDVVEAANMSGQLYGRDDVGQKKVDAMAARVASLTSARNVYAVSERFTETTEAGDVMVCGFDSMSARAAFFTAWETHVAGKAPEDRHKCLFLDGRLSIDTLQVLCVTGDDTHNMRRYRDEFLFASRDAEATVCSLKQTSYMACMIGSVMVNLFTNFTANLLNPVIPYDLPFFTEYDAQNMIFRTER